MNNTMRASTLGAALLAAALAWPALAAPQLGKNLVTNPGAESGEGSPDGFTVVTIPKWTQTGNATAVVYGAGGFPTDDSPGPPNRGLNFFSGGPSNAESAISKRIKVSAFADVIDGVGARYRLSAYLGGFDGQEDHAVLRAEFLGAGGVSLGSVELPTVTQADLGGISGMLKRARSGAVPPGTRNVQLTLTFVRAEGSYNDGYADSLSLVFTANP